MKIEESKAEIKNELAKRYQEMTSLCHLKNIKIDFPNIASSKSKEEIYLSMKDAISNLKTNTKNSLIIIYENILSLTNILSLNYEMLEADKKLKRKREVSIKVRSY